MSTPVTRAKIEKTSAVPRPNRRAVRPPGERNTCSARPSRKPSRRFGRVEEVQRVARRWRVEHDHVEVVLLVQLVQLGDRAQLLRARHRGRELAVDGVGEDLLARSLVAVRGASTISSKVRLASSIIAHSSPSHLHAPLASAIGVDPARLARELLEAERGGQPLRAGRSSRPPPSRRASRARARARPRSSSCRRRPRPRRRSRACRSGAPCRPSLADSCGAISGS